jgi:hypothetical protein
MRILSTALIVCVLVMSTGCAGRRTTEVATPAEMDIARAGIALVTEECSRLAAFRSHEVSGWELALPINTYDRKSLFDYIDGAAELYFVYDFRAVAAAEYQNGETSIVIDVYDMTTPEGAFGIYILNRYPEANYVSIGNEGILAGTALDFWKGRYFCKVYSFDMSEKYQDDVISFGKGLASKIKEAGEKPTVLEGLPQSGLIPGTAKFFSRKLGLDNIHFVSEENVFKLSAETKGVVAEYEVDNIRFPIFIIEYPSSEEANSAFEAYSSYLDGKGKSVPTGKATHKMVKVNGKFTSAKVKDRVILGFWDVEAQQAPDLRALEE